MANIFVNCFNLNIGGGKNILDNYIKELNKNKLSHNYFILTPNFADYAHYSKKNLTVIDINNIYKNNLLFLKLYYFKFPKIFKKYKIDLIFNFGDIIIPSTLPQIYFFDWAYAVYDSKFIWNNMDYKNFLIRKIKVFLIKKYIKKVNLVLVQTQNIKDRMNKMLNFYNIKVIPTPIGLDLTEKHMKKNFKLPSKDLLFLYPAGYAPHKNFYSVLELGRLIDNENLPFKIVLTLSNKDSTQFLGKIKKIKNILNISNVSIQHMPSLYKQCDALFFPSLLESYGLPLVEAMNFKKPILASDLDFAHSICGEYAFYFDPFDPNSILETMKMFNSNKEKLDFITDSAKLIAEKIPDWKMVYNIFENEINNVLP